MRTEQGSGIISSFIGALFVLIFLIALSRLVGILLVSQRLNAAAQNSVRMLSVAGANQNPLFASQIETQIENEFPDYANSLFFNVNQNGNLLTFQIRLDNLPISPWPTIQAGSCTLSASATSFIEY